MSRRFFDPQPFTEGQSCLLGDNASHHIGRVLRMRPGDEITLFNGSGGEWRARIERVEKKAVSVVPLAFNAINRSPDFTIHLALPLIKGERMDYAVQKATEMGATSLSLVQCDRGDVRLDGERFEKKREHLRQVAISACEQCGMNLVPEVFANIPLATFLASATSDLKLIAHPGERLLDRSSLPRAASVTLLTGPEGGFSEAELESARQHGFECFAFGERILRAETAPVALLAVLQALRSA